jgi:hypothetical protein
MKKLTKRQEKVLNDLNLLKVPFDGKTIMYYTDYNEQIIKSFQAGIQFEKQKHKQIRHTK